MMIDQNSFDYDVAISFAGEDRDWANRIATLLRHHNMRVFYDIYEQATLWGKDLYVHLDEIYSKKARYCVMLLSVHYARKLWTNHERQSAQARAFQQQEEYILPVKLDDTSIPGIRPTTGYIDLRQVSLERLVEVLLEKLRSDSKQGTPIVQPKPDASTSSLATEIAVPKIKKTFSQHEQNLFRKEAFAQIRDYFQRALSILEVHDQDIKTDFTDIRALKFACSVYVRGDLKSQCMLWIGGMVSESAINYLDGQRIDIANDNQINDYISVETDGYMLGFRISGMWQGSSSHPTRALLTTEQAAEYLWLRFIAVIT